MRKAIDWIINDMKSPVTNTETRILVARNKNWVAYIVVVSSYPPAPKPPIYTTLLESNEKGRRGVGLSQVKPYSQINIGGSGSSCLGLEGSSCPYTLIVVGLGIGKRFVEIGAVLSQLQES